MQYFSKQAITALLGITIVWVSVISPVFSAEESTMNWGGANDMPIFISDSSTGYIDNALIQTQSRIRFDAGFNNTAPDRAEFFYGACGCARDVPGLNNKAPGPSGKVIPGDILNSRLIETSLDYQELRLDFEYALQDNFSLFTELPVRFIDGEVLESEQGLGDIRAGFKWGLLNNPSHNLTFQLRGYFPTGKAEDGLGTDHLSYEPGLLYLGRFDEHWTAASELRYLIPVGGTSGFATGFDEDYAGEILRYGFGAGYDINISPTTRVTPVLELVSWIVLGGLVLESPSGTPATAQYKKADGETITNLKFGARISLDKKHSVYIGYGKALSDDDWYEEIVRVEFRTTYGG